jgi:hypothetical protein
MAISETPGTEMVFQGIPGHLSHILFERNIHVTHNGEYIFLNFTETCSSPI